MRLVGIVGSPAKKSDNRRLLQFIQRHFTSKIDLELLEIDQVPLFNQDQKELTQEGPIHSINRKILQADGVIISTPEHNHTIPAGLSSLLEWLSFDIHPLRNKAVLIVGASYLDQGTSRSQLHLRQILEAPGIDALTMPGNEFLLGNSQTAFDAEGNLKDSATINHLGQVLDKFTQYAEAVKVLEVEPEIKAEDLMATAGTDTTIEGVDMSDPAWVEKAAEKVGAVSGNTYVQLDRGLLTVDQLNWFLKTIPAELTYADENNQTLYYNHVKDGDEMLASRYSEQVGSPLGECHPPHTYKNVEWVIQQLRSGNRESVNVHVPIHADKYVVHNYIAMHDEVGKYRGINELVLDLQPIIDWYLEQSGQSLVGGTDALSSASVAGAWGTDDGSGKSSKEKYEVDSSSSASSASTTESDTATSASQADDGDTDADSGASQAEAEVASEASSGASQAETTATTDATSSASQAEAEAADQIEVETDADSGASH